VRPRSAPILLGVTGVAALLLVALVLGSPGPSTAQKPPPKPAELQAGYVGAETCMGCHEDAYRSFETTKMGRLFLKHPRNSRDAIGCENCHGPGQAHAEAGGGKGVAGFISFAKDDPTPVERRNDMCLQCHTAGDRLFWAGSAHESRDVACTTCHTVMTNISPKSALARPTVIDTCGSCHVKQRGRQMRFSHMPLREGKMTCTSCHNPHGTVSQALLKQQSVNDNCYSCHTEKRGPFLWEHAPVIESCSNCHEPHGTNIARMLKVPRPRLCQQCHTETMHPSRPYGYEPGSLKFALGRACAQCHVNIHGSNHPSGSRFVR
jgi:DmsE family decaheme c-type cytochrome